MAYSMVYQRVFSFTGIRKPETTQSMSYFLTLEQGRLLYPVLEGVCVLDFQFMRIRLHAVGLLNAIALFYAFVA